MFKKYLIIQALTLLLCSQNLLGQQGEVCPSYTQTPNGSVVFTFPDDPGFDISSIGIVNCTFSDTTVYAGAGTFIQPDIYAIENPMPDFPLEFHQMVFDFTGTGSIVCDFVACTLSVEIISFIGRTTAQNTNLLQWTTATESNSEWMIPERSIDGNNWEILERIPAQGWSSVITEYSVEDTQPFLRTYYRLRMIDLDEITYYSDVIVLERKSISGMTISPIPTEKEVFLQFDSASEEDITIHVIDINGRKLHTQIVSAVIGLNTIEIDLSTYPAGLYYLSLDNGTDRHVERIIKQ